MSSDVNVVATVSRPMWDPDPQEADEALRAAVDDLKRKLTLLRRTAVGDITVELKNMTWETDDQGEACRPTSDGEPQTDCWTYHLYVPSAPSCTKEQP